jgi:hypothetical protein
MLLMMTLRQPKRTALGVDACVGGLVVVEADRVGHSAIHAAHAQAGTYPHGVIEEYSLSDYRTEVRDVSPSLLTRLA